MEFARDTSAGYLTNMAARCFSDHLQAALKEHGVTVGVFPILLLLWEDEGLTQANLVNRLCLEQATVANTLKRMERDGLIMRQPDSDDGRQSLIHLTAKARMLEQPAKAAAQQINDRALSGLTTEEQGSYFMLLRKVITALG